MCCFIYNAKMQLHGIIIILNKLHLLLQIMPTVVLVLMVSIIMIIVIIMSVLVMVKKHEQASHAARVLTWMYGSRHPSCAWHGQTIQCMN